MNLHEQLNTIRRWNLLLETTQLTAQEKQAFEDLTQGLDESGNDWINKLRSYAQKGLLTASLVTALLAAPNLSQAQKQAVKTLTQQSQGAGGEAKSNRFQIQTLTHEQKVDWNKFVDYLDSVGLKGSQAMDVHSQNLGAKQLQAFLKKNPSSTLSYDIVPSIQQEIRNVQQRVADYSRRHGDSVRADAQLRGMSKVDAWLGSKTSAFKFPDVVTVQKDASGREVSQQYNGLLRGDGTTTLQSQTHQVGSPVPKGVEVWKAQSGGYFFTDPNSGDAVLAQGYN